MHLPRVPIDSTREVCGDRLSHPITLIALPALFRVPAVKECAAVVRQTPAALPSFKCEECMDHMWARVGSQLVARVSGPLKFRLVLQPATACLLAVRSGLADAKTGKPPYFWGLLSHRGQRKAMLKEGWKSVGRIFCFALAMDVIYQLIVLRFVYPGEALIVALILAITPYLLLRGLVTRAARKKDKSIGKQPPMRNMA